MKSRKPDFSTYVVTDRQSLRQDITKFLVWAGQKYPNVFISYSEVCRRVHGYARSPGSQSNEVLAVKGAISAVRKSLMADHQLGLVTDPALGLRVTTSDADVLATQMVKSSNRLRSAQDMFVKTADLVDPSKIPNTPENKQLKAWFTSSVMPVTRAISSTDFALKLLPPKKPE